MEGTEPPSAGDDLVWYAAYGSNLWWARFRCYLEGGTPPGSTGDANPGARDPSPPRADRAVRLPRRVVFAGRAASWGGGGVAFLDHTVVAGGDRAWGRLWLVTVQQFADVVAQENGGGGDVDLVRDLGATPTELSIGVVTPLAPTSAVHGRYTGILALDPVEGIPVVTCTSPAPVAPADANPPSAAYRRTLAQGLAECTDLDPAAIDAYLTALHP